MISRYALWMRVEVLNQYYLYGKDRGIALLPTEETRKILAGAGMRRVHLIDTQHIARRAILLVKSRSHGPFPP